MDFEDQWQVGNDCEYRFGKNLKIFCKLTTVNTSSGSEVLASFRGLDGDQGWQGSGVGGGHAVEEIYVCVVAQ